MPMSTEKAQTNFEQLAVEVRFWAISHTEIARQYGCNRSFVSNMLAGREQPTERMMQLLQAAVLTRKREVAERYREELLTWRRAG